MESVKARIWSRSPSPCGSLSASSGGDSKARARSRSAAGLPARVVAALDFAVKLTRDPDGMAEEDTQALREAGLSDEEILDLTLITGYFDFVNRVALGLGVEASPVEAAGYRY